MKIISNNFLETQKIGKQLAKSFLSCKNKEAIVINLIGNLGSGKTTFVQGFASGLRIKKKILSPTFVILNKFKTKNRYFYHIDCYRLESVKEIKDLGFKEIIQNPQNIILIEWGDKIKRMLPKNTVKIKFNIFKKDKRIISYEEKDICSN